MGIDRQSLTDQLKALAIRAERSPYPPVQTAAESIYGRALSYIEELEDEIAGMNVELDKQSALESANTNLQEKFDFVKSEYEKQKREAVKLQGQIAEVKKERIDYPRDIFNELIGGNSPYAFYLFQWVPYQTDARKWRLKMMHDVKTFDGREECGIWPNADSCGSFKDHEVEFIRISKDQGWHAWTDPRGGE